MGISDKMRGLATNVQDGVKSSTLSFFHICLRLITGFLVGLTLALIGQELIGYGTFALIFATIVVLAVVMKLLSAWSFGQIFIFDLIVVLVGMLLRMYILVAP
ncbi:hypothetical protein [Bdellovibrio svalbardensis]|uniref:Uncharacterized protein n=1 Tax=Bdellovibrio svalbardensis TaxID=2972972 RepID=A0ABT6DDD3_9BACT|nr:hypothetical protein [Bdellovibrio svalbardensis]MDG0814852.1 hypothetical protein [Bdellovibrio svalbardensis]